MSGFAKSCSRYSPSSKSIRMPSFLSTSKSFFGLTSLFARRAFHLFVIAVGHVNELDAMPRRFMLTTAEMVPVVRGAVCCTLRPW